MGIIIGFSEYSPWELIVNDQIMIEIRGEEGTDEYKAAEKFHALALENMPNIVDEDKVLLQLLPSIQCYGQKVQDIDLAVLFGHFGGTKVEKQKFESIDIQSFCLTIEVKKHNPEEIIFKGNKCLVSYNGRMHDVSSQSEKQKYSFVKYVRENSRLKKSPFVINLIWFVNCPKSKLPKQKSNIIGEDVTWSDIKEIVSRNSGRVFHFDYDLKEASEVFIKKLVASKLERKRLDAISKKLIDKENILYFKNIREQLLIFRGRGGTGKTVRLLQIANNRYQDYGERILLLTYNKALVADIKRLLVLLGIRDGVAEKSISVMTIHSFMYEILEVFQIYDKDNKNFIEKYEEYKKECLDAIRKGDISRDEIEEFLPEGLQFDILLIDEAQDWPTNERDLLYAIYGFKNLILADGKDQFVRSKNAINWRASINNSQSQVVPLRKSLRLKSSLCKLVADFAQEIEFANWDLEPVPEAYGGKICILTGNPENLYLYDLLKSQLLKDKQEPVDTMFCLPPSMTEKDIPTNLKNEIRQREKAKCFDGFTPNKKWIERGKEIRIQLNKCSSNSSLSKFFKKNDIKYWDGVDVNERDSFPTDLDQFRIVQYESCRGLEGWIVVNFAIDEFFDYKCKTELAESRKSQSQEMIFDKNYHESVALELAKKWMMIPLTRAIDTLYIHINDKESFIGKAFLSLREKNPENIDLIELDSIN